MKHMIITKEIVIDGCNNKNGKPIFCIITGEIFASQIDAAKALGIDNSAISKVCLGKRSAVKGKQFCFVVDVPSHIIEISNSIADAHKTKEINDETMQRLALLEKKNKEYETKMNLLKQCLQED